MRATSQTLTSSIPLFTRPLVTAAVRKQYLQATYAREKRSLFSLCTQGLL